MDKVLITGGAGFIGSELVERLYKNGGWDIVVLDSMSKQIHGESWNDSYLYQKIKGKCKFVYGDVRSLDAWNLALDGVDYVIHLAAETGTGQSMYQINQYNDVNIMGLSNLFQALSLNSSLAVKKIVLASSRSVYGEGMYSCPTCGIVYPNERKRQKLVNGDFNMYCPKCQRMIQPLATTEECTITPKSLYAFTKYAQEKMVETMCVSMGIDYTIFRFQNVYGVGQSLRNPYTGILSVFSSLMLENKPVNVFENGKESRDFINVKDVVSAVASSIKNNCCDSKVINIGSGSPIDVLSVAELLKTKYQSKSEICISGDFRIGDIAHNFADISIAKAVLQFEPKISLEDGLTDFCEWVLSQEKDSSGYEKSLLEMEKSGMFIRK